MSEWLTRAITFGLNVLNPQAGLAYSRIQQVQQDTQRAAATTVSAGATATPAVSAGAITRPVATERRPQTAPTPAVENIQDAQGRRVRLRAKPGGAPMIYGDGLMKPLLQTKGLMFPYQPTITYQQDVIYDTMQLVHTNQDIYSYSRTPALKLSVEGDFTVQNQKEGQYALACIHFLRTVTKMWFGGEGNAEVVANQGTPPPVLLFDAYGAYMFNALPVIVTQFSVTLPNDVDYVPVLYKTSGQMEQRTVQSINSPSLRPSGANRDGATNMEGYAWLPALFKIGVQITVQNTPQRLRQFNMAEFRSGNLLRQGGWV